MKYCFLLALTALFQVSFSQQLEWEAIDLGHTEIAKRGITRMSFVTERHLRDHIGEYLEYDSNGYGSMIADTHIVGGNFHRYETTLDEEGRIKTELIFKEKILKTKLKSFEYDSKQNLTKKTQYGIIYGPEEVTTDYIYKNNALKMEATTAEGDTLAMVVYYNNQFGNPDSSHETRIGRRDRQLLHKTYYAWHSKSQKSGEWKLLISGDTVEVRLFDKKGNLIFEKKPVEQNRYQNGPPTFESRAFLYKKGVLREEVLKNEMFAPSENGAWEHRIFYDKTGAPLDKEGKPYVTRIVEPSKNGWLIENTTVNGDTIKITKTRQTAKGKEVRTHNTFGMPPRSKELWSVELFNTNNQLIGSWMEEYYLEETCVTNYEYSANKTIQTKTCTRTGYDEGAEAIEITTNHINPRGKTTLRTLEIKNYQLHDSLKLFEESRFWYNESNETDSASHKRFGERKTQGNTYKYVYDLAGKLNSILYFDMNDTTHKVVKAEAYLYHNNGQISTKRIEAFNKRAQQMRLTETKYYHADGRLQRIEYGEEKDTPDAELRIIYDQNGLCSKQEHYESGELKKTVPVFWEFRK